MQRVKAAMAIKKKPRKPKQSHYNQEVLRNQSRGKSRERDFPDTFLGADYCHEVRPSYKEQVRRMSMTQANKGGFF